MQTKPLYKVAIFNTNLPDYQIDKYLLSNATTIIPSNNNAQAHQLFEKLSSQYNVVVLFKNNKLAIATNKNK